MKTAAWIFIGVGLWMTLYTGYYYVTNETVVDLGAIEITAEQRHDTHWSPFIGLAVMAVGGIVLAIDRKKIAA